jgi:hypothetical protein
VWEEGDGRWEAERAVGHQVLFVVWTEAGVGTGQSSVGKDRWGDGDGEILDMERTLGRLVRRPGYIGLGRTPG